MLRFIVRRCVFDGYSQYKGESMHTLTSASELESMLRSGGHGPMGYDYAELVGVELVEPGEEES